MHPPLVLDELNGAHRGDLSESSLKALLELENLNVLETQRQNVLMLPNDEHVSRLLSMLVRTAASPIVTCHAGSLTLPNQAVGTLIVRHADRLNEEEQLRLLTWMCCASRVQVFSTAAIPLFPMVIRKSFNDVLFYRLNQVCVTVK